MVNENRVRLMTKMAIYEEHGGRQAIATGEYYKKDYVSVQMIKSFFTGTIAYCIIIGLLMCACGDSMLDKLVSLNVEKLFLLLAAIYLFFMFLYMGCTYLIACITYKKREKMRKVYERALKRLESMYE